MGRNSFWLVRFWQNADFLTFALASAMFTRANSWSKAQMQAQENGNFFIFLRLLYVGSHVLALALAFAPALHVWTGATQAQEEGKRFFFLYLRVCLRCPGLHVLFLVLLLALMRMLMLASYVWTNIACVCVYVCVCFSRVTRLKRYLHYSCSRESMTKKCVTRRRFQRRLRQRGEHVVKFRFVIVWSVSSIEVIRPSKTRSEIAHTPVSLIQCILLKRRTLK